MMLLLCLTYTKDELGEGAAVSGFWGYAWRCGTTPKPLPAMMGKGWVGFHNCQCLEVAVVLCCGTSLPLGLVTSPCIC